MDIKKHTDIMSSHILILPITSKAGHAGIDQPRVEFEEFLGTQSKALQYSGTKRINNDIRGFRKLFDQGESFG